MENNIIHHRSREYALGILYIYDDPYVYLGIDCDVWLIPHNCVMVAQRDSIMVSQWETMTAQWDWIS